MGIDEIWTLKERRAIFAKFPDCPECGAAMFVNNTDVGEILTTWNLKCSVPKCEGRKTHKEIHPEKPAPTAGE